MIRKGLHFRLRVNGEELPYTIGEVFELDSGVVVDLFYNDEFVDAYRKYKMGVEFNLDIYDSVKDEVFMELGEHKLIMMHMSAKVEDPLIMRFVFGDKSTMMELSKLDLLIDVKGILKELKGHVTRLVSKVDSLTRRIAS
jgi:hypothetical protein